jgi:prepilin-type N-terminal cleavage/methylation domain-containing protein
MKNKNLKFKQGFTIIEVVLVLAIAGLIFLAIFITLPALQRAQRDQARKKRCWFGGGCDQALARK